MAAVTTAMNARLSDGQDGVNLDVVLEPMDHTFTLFVDTPVAHRLQLYETAICHRQSRASDTSYCMTALNINTS